MTWDIDTYIKLASFSMSVLAMIIAWLATRRKDVETRFKDGSKRMADLEKRMSSAEQTLTGQPSASDFHRLEIALTEIGGDIKAMRVERSGTNDAIARIERVVSRHENHLLDGSKK